MSFIAAAFRCCCRACSQAIPSLQKHATEAEMRAIQCKAFNGVDALDFTEASEPRPAANEVLVDVHAASVSYMDYLMSSGGYHAAGAAVCAGNGCRRHRAGLR